MSFENLVFRPKSQGGPNPGFPDAAAGRILKSRSRPLPTHPGMKYFRKGNPCCCLACSGLIPCCTGPLYQRWPTAREDFSGEVFFDLNPTAQNPRFPDTAGRTLKSRSRPLPTHPGMKYFRKETLAVDQ